MRMAALSDLDRFFCEQQRRADLPNEEFDEYLFRMSKLRRSHQGDCDAVIRSSFREYSKDDAAKFGGIPAGVPGPSTHQDDLSGITAFPEIRALVNISMTKSDKSPEEISTISSLPKKRPRLDPFPVNVEGHPYTESGELGHKSDPEYAPYLLRGNHSMASGRHLPRASTRAMESNTQVSLSDTDASSYARQVELTPLVASKAALAQRRTPPERQPSHDVLSFRPDASLLECVHNGRAAVSHDLPRLTQRSSDDKDHAGRAIELGRITKQLDLDRPLIAGRESTDRQANIASAEEGDNALHRRVANGRRHAHRSNAIPDNPVPDGAPAPMIDVRAAAHDPAKAGKSKAAVPGFKSRPKKSKELVTPLEYAQRLQAALTELGGRKNTSASQFLKGKRVFYYGRDLNFASAETRGRMELIVKHGGTLVPSYDPAQITHIVTDGAKRPLLRSLGLRTLEDIPGHIHIVKWSWITSGIGRMRYAGSARQKQPERGDAGVLRIEEDDSIQDADDDELPQTDYEFMHASFSERMPPGPVPRFKAGFPPRTKAVSLSSRVQERPRNGAPSIRGGSVDGSDDSGEISHITNFTQDAGPKQRVSTPDHAGPSPLSPPLSPVHGSRSRVYSTCIVPPKASGPAHIRIPEDDKRSGKGEVSADDPLAEFYDHARAERDVELHQHNTNGDAEEGRTEKGEMLHKPGEAKNGKGGFLCDNKGNRSPDRCANQDVVEKLEQLMELHRTKSSMEDHWRVYSYGKAIRALRQHPRRITSYEQARGIDGVGDKTAQKIMEIISTGELRRLDFEKTDDAETITLFQGIYGVGLNTARKWYNRGCRTLQDLNEGKGGVQLSHVQQIGVNYYADINSRMPRAEATEIFERVKTIALRLDPRLFIEILGSYRRGEPDCGDIDVLITRPTDDGKTHRGLLRRLLGELHAQGILTEDLCLPDDFNDLELVYRGLCRRDAYSTRRRIDFLTIPYESRGAALLYYTGDGIFNRSLRMKANVMGFALNQRGLFAGVVRNPSDKRQKLSDGTCVASETEREIFRILGVPWQEPHERVRG